jgi:capsular exopolysaccharide synthesis family protein
MSVPIQHARETHGGDQIDFRALYYLMRERIWIILLCLLVAASGTVAYLLRTPRIYASKAVLQVEQEEQKILNIERVQREYLQSMEFVKTVEQTLRNRALLERVITANKLNQDPRFLGETSDGQPPTVEHLVTQLGRMIESKLRKGTRLIDLTVEHTNPELTATIANSIVKEFIRQNFEHNSTASDVANEFLQKEARELKQRLEQSEQALQAYKELLGTASLEEQQNGVVQKLRELSAKVTETKSIRIGQEATYSQVQKLGENPAALLVIPAVASDPRVLEIRSNITRSESELANLRQRYLPKHPKFIQAQSQLDEWKNSLTNAILNVPQTIRSAYESARAAEASLEQALREQETAALELNKKAIRYNTLAREVESDRALYQSVINRFKETSLTKDIESNKIRVIAQAAVPEKPVKPQKLKIIFLGAFGGLALGAMLVFFLNSLDRSLKTVDQAEGYLGLPVLATVPKLAENKDGHERLIDANETGSPEAEAFRTLRTSLSMLGRKDDRRTFLFTSAIPSEGKTFCSLNYAASLAQQGLKTVVIDGDLRRPMVERSVKNNNQRAFGVTDFITGHKPFAEVIQRTEVENFFYIPAGSHTPNPAELLARTGIDGLIDEALQHFDRVIVDSAPIHAVSDTLLMLNKIQTVCLVLKARHTPKNAILRAVQLLREAEAPMGGVIMNQMPRSRGSGYYYDSYYHYSYYGYYTDKQGRKKNKSGRNREEPEKVAA